MDQERQDQKCKGKTGVRYNEEVKKFAKTLHFVSPKAYDFLRKYITLPHEATLSSWTASADCSPGFSKDVMERLAEARKDHQGIMTDVVLQVDEMAIRKDTAWCQHLHKFEGYVTPIGPVTGGLFEWEGTEELATSALVVLLAGISGGWKVPIGYVFTNKVNGSTMYNITHHAMKILDENGFVVHALISDGFSANCSMCERFGLKEKPEGKGRRNLEMTAQVRRC